MSFSNLQILHQWKNVYLLPSITEKCFNSSCWGTHTSPLINKQHFLSFCYINNKTMSALYVMIHSHIVKLGLKCGGDDSCPWTHQVLSRSYCRCYTADATASVAADRIIQTGSQWCENTMAPVDFYLSIQCARFYCNCQLEKSRWCERVQSSLHVALWTHCRCFRCELGWDDDK